MLGLELKQQVKEAQTKDSAEFAHTPGGSDSSEPVVSLRGIRKRFKTGHGHEPVSAIAGVDLDVAPGELVVLLGPSGCGKTTLLRSIAGLETPDAGTISIAGKTVFSAQGRISLAPERRNVGMIFQSFALWPHMTVKKNIGYPLRARREKKRSHLEIESRIEAIMTQLGISGLGDRYPGQLSGGQQQRVALARALISSPPVLLFDEPLSSVDAKVRKHLREQLRLLKEETNFSGVYVTHDQEEAMELADTLAVMEAGKIQQIGRPREIYESPASLYVADFIGAANRLPGTVVRQADSGGGARVRTALGDVRCQRGLEGERDGTEGWLVFRPEDCWMSGTGGVETQEALRAVEKDGVHRWAGTVRSVSYLGSRTEIRISCSETEVVTWLQAGHGHALGALDLHPGMPVDVAVPVSRLTWFPK